MVGQLVPTLCTMCGDVVEDYALQDLALKYLHVELCKYVLSEY